MSHQHSPGPDNAPYQKEFLVYFDKNAEGTRYNLAGNLFDVQLSIRLLTLCVFFACSHSDVVTEHDLTDF